MKHRILAAAGLIAAAVTASAPASAQGRWDWSAGDRDVRLVGPGVPSLFPELRNSNRGRTFVRRNFDLNRDGFIDRREAGAANRAFAEIAGARRDRFDWDQAGRGGGRGTPQLLTEDDDRGPRGDDRGPRGGDDRGPRGDGAGYDRGAMRAYGFRQTARGATFEMNEQVLFATDSAELRPGALDRLRPLAGYMRSERRVRVSIDGHTDSRGSDAHNQDLSERRADSVRSALEDMGAERARFQVEGHGEHDPVASNATPEGMRRNRRVEITLLGRRADEFR